MSNHNSKKPIEKRETIAEYEYRLKQLAKKSLEQIKKNLKK